MASPTPTAGDLMTDPVLAARADWSLRELADFLTEHAISGAPVVSDQGRAIGVVSLRDLVRHDSESGLTGARAPTAAPDDTDDGAPPAFYLGRRGQAPGTEAEAFQDPAPATVRDIMMPAVFAVEEDASVHDVATRMARGHLHRLLVVRPGTQREVTGIISSIDVLDWLGRHAPDSGT